jgi:serine phosphatase RsbU (regulator of sigma subunit)
MSSDTKEPSKDEVEEARLAALRRYRILDTPPEEDFDDLVRLAAQICDVPIALISLVDRDRLWFKAKVGVDGTQMPRDNSFCAHAVAGERLVVPDARLDERFKNHPVVTGEASFRYYAGVCLTTPDGHRLGTLCVLDRQPRELTEAQLDALSALARQVIGQLELRRTVAHLWSEMDLARKIQTVLLPVSPTVVGYDMSATMLPASTVGGDYYDAFRAGADDWILIGDVSGHGVTSGLVMMMVQSAVRATVQALRREHGDGQKLLSPSHVLAMVNGAIVSNLAMIGKDQYMTISALRVNGPVVSYAGLHQDIFVYRAATRTLDRIETQGIWLGLMDDISGLLEDRQFEMASGDVALLFTDGLTEAKSRGELIGTERLGEAFLAVAQKDGPAEASAESILRGIFDHLRVDTFRDDVTMITLRRS